MPAVCLVGERVLLGAEPAPATVVVRDGRIAEVREGRRPEPGLPLVDVGTDVLMPGLVDSHVHLNEPGRTEWEGFRTGTRAAAAGGVTTLVEMPLNSVPVTTSAEALRVKCAAAVGQLHVDVGFWGGVVPGNAGALAGLARAGALGCKAFLVSSGIDEFPCVTEADLLPAMRELAAAGLPLLAHAELDLGPGADVAGDPRRYELYLASRPPAWEEAAIELLVRLSSETGCAVHVVHLSAASALPLLREARRDGVRITVETCAHYLALAAEEVPDGSTVHKCAPPIREAANREGLWRGLAEGLVDTIVTDHSPCTAELKARGDGDFFEAWGGVSSLQLALPVVWTEARRRGFGLADLSRWMSAAPARVAGLPQKGRLEPGADADLVAFDPDATFVVTPESLEVRNKVTPYAGRTLHGVVRRTWLRGRPVFDSGRPELFPSYPSGETLLHRQEVP